MNEQLSVVLLLIYKNKFKKIKNKAETDYNEMYNFNLEDLSNAFLEQIEVFFG